MQVTVRDLEVAQVLAREVKAAAARSAQASLRADQIALLFGAAELDASERGRIQAALEMVGLDPQPSLLEAEPDAPVAFAAAGARSAVQAGGQRQRRFGAAPAGGGRRGTRPDPARGAVERGEFPTVGEFARSTFERARRRLADDPGPAEAPAVNGAGGDHDDVASAHDFDYEPPQFDQDEPELEAPPEAQEEPQPDAVEEPSDAAAGPQLEPEPEAVVEPAATEPEPEAEAVVETPAAEPEPEPVVEPPAAESEPPAVEEAEPAPEPEQTGDRAAPPLRAEIAAALIAAAALPVVGASLGGWRFGAPYLALVVAATGWLAAKARAEDGATGGVIYAVRGSPTALGALRASAALTIASVAAAFLLAAATTSKSSSTGAAAVPAALGDWTRPVADNAARIRASARKKVVRRRRAIHRAPRTQALPATSQPASPAPSTAQAPPSTTQAAPSTTQAGPSTTQTAPSTTQAQPPSSTGGGTQGLHEVP